MNAPIFTAEELDKELDLAIAFINSAIELSENTKTIIKVLEDSEIVELSESTKVIIRVLCANELAGVLESIVPQ